MRVSRYVMYFYVNNKMHLWRWKLGSESWKDYIFANNDKLLQILRDILFFYEEIKKPKMWFLVKVKCVSLSEAKVEVYSMQTHKNQLNIKLIFLNDTF